MQIKLPRGIAENTIGTGFFINNNTLLTANHILPSHEAISNAELRFNFHTTGHSQDLRISGYYKRIFNEKLDYCAVVLCQKPEFLDSPIMISEANMHFVQTVKDPYEH